MNRKEEIAMLDSLWNTEDEDEEGDEDAGDVNFWNTEIGWVENPHLLSLDEIKEKGYPNEGGNEKLLGKTGLRHTPYGLAIIWYDMSRSWNISIAKLQRITSSHGLCLWAKDQWFMDMNKIFRKATILMRGETDPVICDEFATSSLTYKFSPAAQKEGGSFSYLSNRLGMLGEIDATLGVAQATTLIELSIASIMTVKSKKLSQWIDTIEPEYEKFRAFGVKRKKALEGLYDKLERRRRGHGK